MTIARFLIALGLLLPPFSAATAEPAILAAARSFRPEVKWQVASVVSADIDCNGRRDSAILGTTQYETVVAVFLRGSRNKPDAISFEFTRLNTGLVRLEVEALVITDQEFKAMLGARPQGNIYSRKCKGLSLSDSERDTVHIYWNKARKELAAWSL